jgi:hypothetical protein
LHHVSQDASGTVLDQRDSIRFTISSNGYLVFRQHLDYERESCSASNECSTRRVEEMERRRTHVVVALGRNVPPREFLVRRN